MMLRDHCLLYLPTWEVLKYLILLRQPTSFRDSWLVLLLSVFYSSLNHSLLMFLISSMQFFVIWFRTSVRYLSMLPSLYITNVHLIYNILWTVCRRRAVLSGSPLFLSNHMGLCYIKVILMMPYAWGMVGHLLDGHLAVFVVANFQPHMHLVYARSLSYHPT